MVLVRRKKKLSRKKTSSRLVQEVAAGMGEHGSPALLTRAKSWCRNSGGARD
jgi:hypothetical protein